MISLLINVRQKQEGYESHESCLYALIIFMSSDWNLILWSIPFCTLFCYESLKINIAIKHFLEHAYF